MRRSRQYIAGWKKMKAWCFSKLALSYPVRRTGGEGMGWGRFNGGVEARLKTEPVLHSRIHPYLARGSLKIH